MSRNDRRPVRRGSDRNEWLAVTAELPVRKMRGVVEDVGEDIDALVDDDARTGGADAGAGWEDDAAPVHAGLARDGLLRAVDLALVVRVEVGAAEGEQVDDD